MGRYRVNEISLMTKINQNTLRTYLGHYSFDKFLEGRYYRVCNDFYDTLIDYLFIKRRYELIKNVERLRNERENIGKGTDREDRATQV